MENMIRFSNRLFLVISRDVSFLAIALAGAVLSAAGTAQAATINKTNNTDNLNLTTSWAGGVVPGTNDIAQWTSTVTAGNTTASLGADLTWAGIKIVGPGGLVTINAGNTLTVGTSGIDLSTATTNLTLNCGLTLRNTGQQSWKAAANRTLNIAGTFTHTGAVVDFTSFNATAALSGIANDASGILGPWATTGSGVSLNYATNNAGAISAYTGQTPSANADLSDVTDTNVNYSFNPGAGTATQTVAISANTLLYKGTGSGNAIANNGKSNTVNGLLGQGTGRYIISGTGNLMIGATRELVCHFNIAFSAITCPIVDYNDGSSHASSVTISIASGVGEWTFGASGVNATYSGGTTLNLPTAYSCMCNFYVTSFGTGPITVNGPGMIKNQLGGNLTNSLTLNGSAGLRNGGTYSGPITVNGASYFSLNGNNVTISGNVSGPGGWNVNGTASANSALLSGVNTYTGPTIVSLGTLKAGRASVANVSGAFGLNSAVTMANAATAILDLNGFDTQIGSLTGGGTTGGNVTNSSATTSATLTVGGNNTSTNYLGGILGPRLGLTKIGTGTQTLSGMNTYTGATTVSNGVLMGAVNGSCANSDVTVAPASGTASLGISVTNNTMQWTCKSLTTSGAGVPDLTFCFATNVTPSTTVAPLNVSNLAAFTTRPTVTITGGTNLVIGTAYPLMTWGSTSGTPPGTADLILPQGVKGSLGIIGNTLNFTYGDVGCVLFMFH